jgi:hypothetical protein
VVRVRTFDDVGDESLGREGEAETEAEEGEALVAALLALEELDHKSVQRQTVRQPDRAFYAKKGEID